MIEESIITKELIAALRDGSHDAYKAVYIHYRKPLERFMFSLLRSREEAEEVTQDVFVKLWEKRKAIDPNKNFKTYFYTVARNTVTKLTFSAGNELCT